ncbi:MAG TPA: single-stranded DNA-binding protein [bacterium]|nr:single-stranded DNA-binding protein [bacterium]
MLNRIILIGRLTRDPELKYTPSSGVALASFTLAVDRPFQSAKKEKETDFIRIIAWGKLAERCKQHLGKGRLVAVEGKLQIRNWDTPQGERRSIAEVRADDVRFLDRPPQRDGGVGMDENEYSDDYQGYSQAKRNDPPKKSGRQDFGSYDESSIDEEIDLDDDDPFKEDF